MMIKVKDIASRVRNRVALLDRRRVTPIRLSSPVASFTFDDFPRSAYEIGGKMLEVANAKATYFVAGSYMDRTVDGVAQFGGDTLKAAHAAGHEIGCHTFDHKHLGAHGLGFTRATCEKNARFVNETLGTDITMSSFAYPYGDTSPTIKNEIGRRFRFSRGIGHALNSDTVDLAQIRIVSLESRFIHEVDIARTVADAVAQNSWIVFMSHDVAESPSPYGSSPSMLDSVLRVLKAANIPALPLKDAAALAIGAPHA